MEIGQKLVELRIEKNVYQKELAAYLNVSIGTISNYENDVHYPDLNTLNRLADYFGVTIDYMLGRTEYRYDYNILNRPLTKNYTVAGFINTTLELPQKDWKSLVEYAELLKMRHLINEARKSSIQTS